MAKANAKKPVAKKAAAKPAVKKVAKPAVSAMLKKPKKGEKSYSKTQLIAHLAEAVSKKGLGDVSKKQVTALLEELAKAALDFAPVGAAIPGLGKLVVRETPKRPTTTRIIFGKEQKIAAKPAGRKLVFRVAKVAKEAWNK
jgi:pantoate kinase